MLQHYYLNLHGENWFNYENFYSFVIDKLNSGSKMAEVGSWIGRSISYFAVESKLKNKNIECYCIDIWEPYWEIPDHQLFNNDGAYKTFIQNTDPVRDVVFPVRGDSVECSKKFENNFFDFIFIDAAHDYENVKKDIQHWFPKLKSGSIFGGHDYTDSQGVYRAVNEFFNNQQIYTNGSCWFIIKN